MGRNRTTWESRSTWNGGKTTLIRVPIVLKDDVLAYARAVDSKLIFDESRNIPLLPGDFLQVIDRYIHWRCENYRSTQKFTKPDITARAWDELRKLQKLIKESPELLRD
ncbi:hypothetical protein [Nostoc sp. 'Peltigera membranacea cyanobiont' 232]|uniref:hypothetical protein n=1 Tax=Nostoc sp. 'Peltigera membranacea cyanobiont' 232 TaxID=2014531 RepID=UPI000B95BE11|nr:hypothetical protein [Nostoc sp. 'Peltigera membranacea cyanobiont' 232]OYE03024.1 hypothetical protein CDG79_20515 [Nostoc sp. 'Peltigera membranacea cyanobiont' 232]